MLHQRRPIRNLRLPFVDSLIFRFQLTYATRENCVVPRESGDPIDQRLFND